MPSSFRFRTKYLSKPREYKGYTSMKVVTARLVEITLFGLKGEKKKLMKMVHAPSGEDRCTDCNALLSVLIDHEASRTTYLEVADFHKRYRPLDMD